MLLSFVKYSYLVLFTLFSCSVSLHVMDTKSIEQTLEGLATDTQLKPMPRGMLDQLAPSIYKATAAGHSLHSIRRALEEKHNLTTTVASMSAALRRNKLVPERKGHTSHNVCYI